MGGLIVRQFLISHPDLIQKVQMLYFYAVPTDGATAANVVRYVSNSPQVDSMVTLGFNNYLSGLYNDWVGSKQLKQLPTYCAFETQDMLGGRIVPEYSARALCTEPSDPLSGDHVQIVKPRYRGDPRFTVLATAIKASLQHGLVASPIAAPPKLAVSLEDHDAFAFQIPFLISNMGDSGIDNRSIARNDLAGEVSRLEGIANFPSPFGRAPSREEMLSFLAKILEYYISREVLVIQDPNPPVSFSYDSNVGQTTHIKAPINVPDAHEYSKGLWVSQIESLGLRYNPHHGGPDDAWSPTVMRLPSGVSMKWVPSAHTKGFTLRYERLPTLIFDFEVDFPGLSEKAMPPRGGFSNQSRTLNDVGVTVRSKFQWHGDPSKGEEYRIWAKNIVDGLKSRLTVPESKSQ